MNPAYSVIFFSTATGAGYGLLIWLALLAAAGFIPPRTGFGIAAFALALALVTGGLLASTAHLGHPERAWRALTQWRTSWLSREGIAALVTYVPVLLYALGWIVFGASSGTWAFIGLVGAALAAATIVCTAMIYASLKPVPRWRSGWVVPVYLAMALSSGLLLLVFLLHAFGLGAAWMIVSAIAALVAAWAIRLAYWRQPDDGRTTAGSATGLARFGDVRQLESPHTSANFVMKEMGYRLARRHAQRLKGIALAAGAALPSGLLVISLAVYPEGAAALIAVSAVSALAGVLIERWLFFAEARHVVTLYYGGEPSGSGRGPLPRGKGPLHFDPVRVSRRAPDKGSRPTPGRP